MKRIFIVLLLSIVSIYASMLAVTDKGKVVILNSDGTWEYTDNNKTSHLTNKKAGEIPLNKSSFTKPKEASFLLKSSINSSACWINRDKWNFIKITGKQDGEYFLRFERRDLYAVTIPEEVEIKVEELVKIAVENLKTKATDVKIVKKEYRVVNGKKVIFMQMQGVMSSIKFTYLGYYYSDKSGSTQLVVYTATNLVDKYKSEIFKLLNGFTTR